MHSREIASRWRTADAERSLYEWAASRDAAIAERLQLRAHHAPATAAVGRTEPTRANTTEGQLYDVCLLGGSFARNLCGELASPGSCQPGGPFLCNVDSSSRTCAHIDLQQADNLAALSLGNNSRAGRRWGSFLREECRSVAVHLGQWDLLGPKTDPARWARLGALPGGDVPLAVFLDDFQRGFELGLGWLASVLKPQRRKLLVLSTDYNPLACRHTTCPPLDLRNPPMIAELNRRMEDGAARHGAEFLDNADLMGPMWDVSTDWCHAKGRILRLMSARLLAATQVNSTSNGP